jgi:RNA methyltransferase, TrmH family
MRTDETRICGLSAVRARFQRDASSIARLYFDQPTSKKIGVLCRALAAARKVYRCVEPAELERIADSVHHGGIVAIVADAAPRAPSQGDIAAWARARENLVVLDRIGNAHNLGAIARTAAYFGVPRIVIAGDPSSARPGPAAYRVAEGGLDSLETWSAPVVAPFLRSLAGAGYDVVGAATRGGARGLSGAKGKGPWALVLGNEESGLAPAVEAACTRLVTIPGGGRVESLNVSAAAAVLIHELVRRADRR